MLAKLIVTGATRQQALERSRRALAEFVVDGMPTVLPFHRAVVADPAFAPEATPRSPCTPGGSRPSSTTPSSRASGQAGEAAEPAERERVVVEVGGRRLEVVLPAGLGASGEGRVGRGRPGVPAAGRRPVRRPAATR